MNPYKCARTSHNLTQLEVANLAGITVQNVTNLEAGLFNTPPESLRRLFDIPPKLYTEWVKEQRIANSHYFDNATPSDHFPTFRLSVTPSFRGFCRYLVFQPSLLAEFERYHRNASILQSALSEVGLERYVIQRLIGANSQ